MAAELHLTEDAFALHLLLEGLEGLVNIVVADENLHASILSNGFARVAPAAQPVRGEWLDGARKHACQLMGANSRLAQRCPA